ncbi:ankyrin repeat domain-containing protein 6 isoform X2 [Diprion similis]|uniref:ankyrin repeat domain-containing protein 6 isoform X2 n=1 Tax=Diprion similis TaxID=362088 RepID=UPI001EF8767E|nr:ankyrin repeat domain-containing protein 6 isoform X2 [Diprion similis]
MPKTRSEVLLDMFGHADGGITRAYELCVAGMAEKVREASVRGDAQRLARLLDDAVKPLPDEHGRSPLLLAASGGHLDACTTLILHGSDVNAADNSGSTPLQRAAAEGHLEVVELLLKHGADISKQDTIHGNSALHEAAWRGYSRTVAALAKALGTQRAPLHARNLAGFAPLHLACQNGHNQSCRELLLAGCNPDLQNNYGDTPLHTSARYGHAGVTRILISALCRVSDQNKNGDTALHIAAAMGRRKLTRILLEAGCDRTLRNKQAETAKDIARRKNLSEILEIISKARSRSRARSKSRDEESKDKVDEGGEVPQVKSAGKGDKKREKTGSGTSGSRDSNSKKEKKKLKGGKQHKVHFEKAVGKQWSPYGCHYYPDPDAFPQPRLDSLPSDPLARGEQYYLDLAGNIRKGPVGVGYTCYCAPFFRHMEAKLERDKAELKAHIDQAHERLDLKVTNLERRTRGQISELTRCVVAERARCDERHLHLQQWISRGTRGRHSERPPRLSTSNPQPPTRARSLEDLLDDRPHDRSFEIPGETPAHGGSLDDLDIPAIPRLSRSMRDIPSGSGTSRPTLRVLDVPPRLNETFDGDLKRDRTSPLGAAMSPALGSRHQVLQQISGSHDRVTNPHQTDVNMNCKIGEESPRNDWRGAPGRRSVHEMIRRFQNVPGMHNRWRGQRSGSSEPTSPDHSQSSQNQRVQPQGGNDSESSEGEDDVVQPEPVNGGLAVKEIATDGVRYESIARMPYRSRNAVYSPTPPLHDAHNDSGYSTRMYGSSKGASPSLSGQLECDGIIPPASQGPYPSGEQLAALLEQPRGRDLTVYERTADNVVINIGAASLV